MIRLRHEGTGATAQQNEIDRLRDQNAALKRALRPPRDCPAAWKLTPTEDRIVAALIARETVTVDAMQIMAPSDKSEDRSDRYFAVVVYRIRRQLGVRIVSVYGAGYRMDSADRARLGAEMHVNQVARPEP